MCIRDSTITGAIVGVGSSHKFSAVRWGLAGNIVWAWILTCLLYTSDAADERSSVDLGGRRIIKKKTNNETTNSCDI